MELGMIEPKPKTLGEKEGKEKLSFRVLVADDDPDLRALLVASLEYMGHKVKAVYDGQLLVDELSKGNESYDLIISDNTMPVKKGIDALKEIRLMEKFKGIPFIIITTDSTTDGSLEKDIIKSGALYLPKPYTEEQLSKAIDQVTKSKS